MSYVYGYMAYPQVTVYLYTNVLVELSVIKGRSRLLHGYALSYMLNRENQVDGFLLVQM